MLFQSLFFSCNKKKLKPTLEISLSDSLTKISTQTLETFIGSSSGKEESFGERRNILVFFSEEDCLTCKKLESVVTEWQNSTKTKIYIYKENDSSMLKKLGSSDGVNLTSGRLVAFVNGERKASIAGTYDLETTQKIDIFVKRYFSLPETKNFITKNTKIFTGLKELRESISNNEEFILYLERESCPDCRRFSDPSRGNGIREVLSSFNGTFCTITTEESLKELKQNITVDNVTYSDFFEYFNRSGTNQILWQNETNEKKKTEYLTMIIALRFVNPYPEDDEAFVKSVDEFAKSFGTKTFSPIDRNVPSFCVSYATPFSLQSQDEAIKVLKEAYDATKNGEKFLHRALFYNYFGLDNALVSDKDYNSFLKKWISIFSES